MITDPLPTDESTLSARGVSDLDARDILQSRAPAKEGYCTTCKGAKLGNPGDSAKTCKSCLDKAKRNSESRKNQKERQEGAENLVYFKNNPRVGRRSLFEEEDVNGWF